MIEKFPTKEWIAIRDKWQSEKTRRLQKYFHLHRPCLLRSQEIAKTLGIDKISDSVFILDISAGFCFFPWLCTQYGHKVAITDISMTEEYIQEVRNLLKMPDCIIFEYPSSGFIPLPNIGKFDVITALQVAPQSLWGITDWMSFLFDCRNHLNENGKLLISPNESNGFEVLKSVSSAIKHEIKANCIIINKGDL